MIYKIRVILDSNDSVFRDIEIKEKQTLWNLHLGIKSAFSLRGDELSSFYLSDENWSEGRAIPLEDMSDDEDGEIMSDVYLSEAFQKKGDKMLFKYGFIDLWEFFCELHEIKDEKSSVNYPITTFRFGATPLKIPNKSAKISKEITTNVDDEFENFSNDIYDFDSEEGNFIQEYNDFY